MKTIKALLFSIGPTMMVGIAITTLSVIAHGQTDPKDDTELNKPIDQTPAVTGAIDPMTASPENCCTQALSEGTFPPREETITDSRKAREPSPISSEENLK